ncbi:MAG TPA: GntR family transcriptional regulator [Actinomycetota bacterium]|nr:GntR family transcriptional regulator [Actinomycetota bacterium]
MSLRVRIRDGAGPPSRQLHDQIAAAIDRGALLPEDRLPPVRRLAEDLGLAPNTVASAYRALEDDGLLVGRGRAGTFVAEGGARTPDPEARLGEAAERFFRRAEQLGFGRDEALRILRRS